MATPAAARVVVAWCPSQEGDLASHLVLAEARRSFGVPARATTRVGRHCKRCGSTTHGRPVLMGARAAGERPLHLSISRAADLTVVALTDAGPVGVDVERRGAAAFLGFDEVVAHPSEALHDEDDRTTAWVRKESLLKATGDGLAVDPRAISSSPSGEVRLPQPGAPAHAVRAWIMEVEITPAHVAALSVIAALRPHLVVRRAAPGARARRASW